MLRIQQAQEAALFYCLTLRIRETVHSNLLNAEHSATMG
jgi:hypothetical protein